MYPNPFKDTVNIASVEYLEAVSFSIYDAAGVHLIERTALLVNGKATIDLFNFSSGVYYFKILLSNGDNEVHKAIKL